MKKIFLFLFVAFALQPVTGQTNDEKLVAKAVDALKQALIDADGTRLDALTVPQLSYGHSSGLIEDKATFIKSLVSGKSDFATIQLSDQSIAIVEKTAIVRHNLEADITDAGVSGHVRLHVLTIWIKTQKGWQLLARQATKPK